MRTSNGDMPAMAQAIHPTSTSAAQAKACGLPSETTYYQGLTKREHFAAMAMQGLCANTYAIEKLSTRELGREAIFVADETLAELEKTNEE